MTPREHDLVMLLRWRDRVLSPADEAGLRERLLTDPELRQLWQRVDSAAAGSISWSEVSAVENAELIALAWDRQTGWLTDLPNSAVLISDLGALDRADRDASPPQTPPGVTRRLSRELDALLTSLPDSPPKETQPGEGPNVVAGVMAVMPVRDRGPGAKPERVALARGFATALVVAVVMMLALLGRTWRSIPEVVPDEPSRRQEIVRNVGPDSTSPTEIAPSVSPQPPPTENDPDRNVAKDNYDRTEGAAPSFTPGPVPHVPEQGLTQSWAPLLWKRIQGLAAERNPESGLWELLSTGEKTLEATAFLQTLGESWATASSATGERLVLGSQTIVQVTLMEGTMPSIEVGRLYGRVGLAGLRPAAAVVLQDAEWEATWEVLQEGTEISLEVSGSTRRICVLKGGLRSGSQQLSRQQALIFGVDSRPRIERGPAALAWLERAPSLPPLERHLSQAIEGSGNVAATLLELGPGENELTLQAAARWSLALDPIASIPVAANSPSAGQRLAVIQWLAAPEHRPAEIAAATTALLRSLNRTNLSIDRWYQAARGELPLTAGLLQEMALGISASEPLFVRHSAIEFLRKITGQKLAGYDPEQPTRSAIAEVRAAVRQRMSTLPP